MARLVTICCLALALPATAAGQVAGETLVGVVTPTVGVHVDASGGFTDTGGTQPATVTREQRGETTVVTVTPAF